MKGLELSRRFFEEHGRPMLKEFPELYPLLAAGLVGSGSEKYGFDDEISRDHDYEAGFCLFLPGEDVVSRRDAFLLERAYDRLPRTFLGVERPRLSPVGGARCGVMRISDFYKSHIGCANGELTLEQWLFLPSSALCEATNGAVFYDGPGEFTSIRKRLCEMPEDARKKRLAGQLLLMAQAGPYNFERELARGDADGANLSAHEFVSAATEARFLLERKYRPYYKWQFRALRTFDEATAGKLSVILSDRHEDRERSRAIEETCAFTAELLRAQGLSARPDNDLEKHAYAVNDGITDGGLRNEHVLYCT